MQKLKTVRPNGLVTVTKTEERYPTSANILMCHGFGIILLNMTLGLLPVTIWGTRMKYFKCSISQLYTLVFFLCFIILSVIFVPVAFFPRTNQATVTNFMIMVILGVAHVLGYIILIIRGHYVASKIPKIWLQLCKLLQLSVIDVYGKNCYLFKDITKFTRWAMCEYIAIIVTTMGSIAMFSIGYDNVFEDSRKHYKLDYVLGLNSSKFVSLQAFTFQIGYFIWQLCSFSHVLVSMLLCFFVIIITICLKSVNRQIYEFMQKLTNGQLINTFKTSGVKFDEFDTMGTEFANGSSKLCTLDQLGREKVIRKMDTIKTILLITEELTTTMSTVWGVSLIVEALILISAGTINTFNLLSAFQDWDRQGQDDQSEDGDVISINIPTQDEWISLLVTVCIHFYFLFKLACKVNEMVIEVSMG
ncbi:unnamed protein product [Orchesella dallaii]|uniref:Gustatory receptor n=1 Tax=Orchesella dallaii TaxID=48710 RepID=A0ABP1QF47_9HEXA